MCLDVDRWELLYSRRRMTIWQIVGIHHPCGANTAHWSPTGHPRLAWFKMTIHDACCGMPYASFLQPLSRASKKLEAAKVARCGHATNGYQQRGTDH
jgi:hypothetical protein